MLRTYCRTSMWHQAKKMLDDWGGKDYVFFSMKDAGTPVRHLHFQGASSVVQSFFVVTCLTSGCSQRQNVGCECIAAWLVGARSATSGENPHWRLSFKVIFWCFQRKGLKQTFPGKHENEWIYESVWSFDAIVSPRTTTMRIEVHDTKRIIGVMHFAEFIFASRCHHRWALEDLARRESESILANAWEVGPEFPPNPSVSWRTSNVAFLGWNLKKTMTALRVQDMFKYSWTWEICVRIYIYIYIFPPSLSPKASYFFWAVP